MDFLDELLVFIFTVGCFTLLLCTVIFVLEGIERVQNGIKRRKRLQKKDKTA